MANPQMRPGEICLASFPFGDTAGMKLRPVLVLAGPIPEVLMLSARFKPRLVPITILAP